MPPQKEPAGSRAREMLEKIRRGEYAFTSAEVSEILNRLHWLGRWQARFVSIEAVADHLVTVQLSVPLLGRIFLTLCIVDLWHDSRVSSLDFQVATLSVAKWRNTFFSRLFARILIIGFLSLLRWNGFWHHEFLRFVLRAKRTVRVYVEWPAKKSPLLENISVIGVRIQKKSVVFYTFRRPMEMQSPPAFDLQGEGAREKNIAANSLAVVFSWLLLGVYAFVLVDVTLPVLSGAFQLMPQETGGLTQWLLTQIYNLFVILLSYFFLRITMLPLYLKWNKSREELATLISLEERDHQYLRPLTELVKKMQQTKPSAAKSDSDGTARNVSQETIAKMIELMSNMREQSRRRLLGMTRMRRGWVQDLIIGYIFIFSLEWMYYKGLLTPLSVSIEWVNRVMMRLFLYE
jgi:hypothetical protein